MCSRSALPEPISISIGYLVRVRICVHVRDHVRVRVCGVVHVRAPCSVLGFGSLFFSVLLLLLSLGLFAFHILLAFSIPLPAPIPFFLVPFLRLVGGGGQGTRSDDSLNTLTKARRL